VSRDLNGLLGHVQVQPRPDGVRRLR
jgi:hypothetical protein